jgi:hypothetical protein
MQIYKTTNLVNGKIYIGKDVKSRPNYLGSGIRLKNAIIKYSRDNFNKEILEDNIIDKQHLSQREIYWIEYYKSNDREIGYNLTKGGEGGDTTTNNPNREEIIKKRKGLAAWNKGLVGFLVGEKNGNYGNPTGFKGNKTSFKSGELHPMYNKKQSNDHKTKRVESRKINGTANKNGSEKRKKIILQYDLQNNFIKEWSGVKEAMSAYNQARVGDVANGKARTAAGYYWKWKN